MDDSEEILDLKKNLSNKLYQGWETLATISEKDESTVEKEADENQISIISSTRRSLNLIPRVSLTIRRERRLRIGSLPCRQSNNDSLIRQKIRDRIHLSYLLLNASDRNDRYRRIDGSSRASRLPRLTVARPLPSLYAARQAFDGLPVVHSHKTPKEIVQPIENIQQDELLINMAAMNIQESASTSH